MFYNMQRITYASSDTGREKICAVPALIIQTVNAKRAFLDLFADGIKLRCAIRTGLGTIPAPDAYVLVNQHDAVFFALKDGIVLVEEPSFTVIRHWAGGPAGRLFTVITGASNKCQSRRGINPRFLLDHPAVTYMVW